jgi:FAD:protein FMN transferase
MQLEITDNHRFQRRMRPLLGTFVEMGIEPGSHCDEAFEPAFSAIADVHRLLSFHSRDSELTQINLHPGSWIEVSKITARVLTLAKHFGRQSEEHFNCTVGGAMVERGLLPNHGSEYILHGTSHDIQIDGNRVRLLRSVQLTMDGIAKGFAIDYALSKLRAAGIKRCWINAGGDCRVLGVALPIQRREVNGQACQLGYLHNAAIATSAIRARPTAGFRGEIVTDNANALRSNPSQINDNELITVVASSAWRADALTKVAACLPAEVRHQSLLQLGGRLIAANPLPTCAAA